MPDLFRIASDILPHIPDLRPEFPKGTWDAEQELLREYEALQAALSDVGREWWTGLLLRAQSLSQPLGFLLKPQKQREKPAPIPLQQVREFGDFFPILSYLLCKHGDAAFAQLLVRSGSVAAFELSERLPRQYRICIPLAETELSTITSLPVYNCVRLSGHIVYGYPLLTRGIAKLQTTKNPEHLSVLCKLIALIDQIETPATSSLANRQNQLLRIVKTVVQSAELEVTEELQALVRKQPVLTGRSVALLVAAGIDRDYEKLISELRCTTDEILYCSLLVHNWKVARMLVTGKRRCSPLQVKIEIIKAMDEEVRSFSEDLGVTWTADTVFGTLLRPLGSGLSFLLGKLAEKEQSKLAQMIAETFISHSDNFPMILEFLERHKCDLEQLVRSVGFRECRAPAKNILIISKGIRVPPEHLQTRDLPAVEFSGLYTNEEVQVQRERKGNYSWMREYMRVAEHSQQQIEDWLFELAGSIKNPLRDSRCLTLLSLLDDKVPLAMRALEHCRHQLILLLQLRSADVSELLRHHPLNQAESALEYMVLRTDITDDRKAFHTFRHVGKRSPQYERERCLSLLAEKLTSESSRVRRLFFYNALIWLYKHTHSADYRRECFGKLQAAPTTAYYTSRNKETLLEALSSFL